MTTKILRKLACATAFAVSMGAAHAAPILNDWVFNPNGGGFDNGHMVNEYLDVNGNSFHILTPAGDGTYTFTQHAVFNITQADSNGQLFPIDYAGGNISAVFEATGTGRFGEAFRFTGGVLKMYQNPVYGQYGGTDGIYGANLGNLIGSFAVLNGGGLVDTSGAPTMGGQISLTARATSLAEGYFFRGDGKDMAHDTVLNLAFANANTLGWPTERLIGEVACQYAGFTGPGCDGGTFENVPGAHFFLANNGQFKLVEVPEPGSLALFGIAMLGAGVVGRKRAGKA